MGYFLFIEKTSRVFNCFFAIGMADGWTSFPIYHFVINTTFQPYTPWFSSGVSWVLKCCLNFVLRGQALSFSYTYPVPSSLFFSSNFFLIFALNQWLSNELCCCCFHLRSMESQIHGLFFFDLVVYIQYDELS